MSTALLYSKLYFFNETPGLRFRLQAAQGHASKHTGHFQATNPVRSAWKSTLHRRRKQLAQKAWRPPLVIANSQLMTSSRL